MKKSEYLIISPYNEGYIFYNMVTKAMFFSETDDLYEVEEKMLYDNGFLINEEYNEFDIAHKAFLNAQNDRSNLVLTILTTFSCNLSCEYCYQNSLHGDITIIDESIADGIIFEIKKFSEIKNVHIEWTGGEPILALDKIVTLAKRIISFCESNGIYYSSSINTNMYEYNSYIKEKLYEAKIFTISTTLAGSREIHDRYRKTKSNNNSFDRVVTNIEEALKAFEISISINLTAQCHSSILSLIDDLVLLNERSRNKLSISFLCVSDYGFGDKSIYLSHDKYIDYYYEFLHYAHKKGLKVSITSNFRGKNIFCGAQHNNSYAIGPTGKIFKCSSTFEGDSIGYVTKNGFEIHNQKLNFDPYNDERCSKCDILPYCNGGCTHCRECGLDFCPEEQKYLNKILNIYVDCILNR